MLAFLFQFADLCELLAERLQRPFAEMLDEAWAGFGLGATARIEIGDQERTSRTAQTKHPTRELQKRLHTRRTTDDEQVVLNTQAPTCGACAKPSNGLEPLTPSLPWRCSTN